MSRNFIGAAYLVVGATAVGLEDATPALINGTINGRMARGVIISNNGSEVLWRGDGNVPQVGYGHPLGTKETLTMTSDNWRGVVKQLQFIQVSAAGTLFIEYTD